ncbi:MAG TPA: phosphate ABC transporter substrate-binding protein [Verrucomicrobiae bacterium]|nr:phosphate ABC transporter substrate-binding protein [Verrucomicrobiae bacterium]
MRKIVSNECFGWTGMKFVRSICVALLSVVVAGCPSGSTVTEQKVTIRGSNTVGEELAPRLIALYKKDHPTVEFDVEFKGSSYGMGALMAGRSDIAAASRPLTKNELALARDRAIDFNDYVIGAYSVAVIVNAASPIGDLTKDQVRDIFTGVVQNWNEVGGPDAPIHWYIRDEISGTHLGFRELAMENKPYGLGQKTFTSYRDIIQAVAHDANGIGYSSIDVATNAEVKAVSVGGVPATAATVNQGQYPYARVLHLYTDKAKESQPAHDFIEFVVSERGQQILDQMGFVPHP